MCKKARKAEQQRGKISKCQETEKLLKLDLGQMYF